MSNSLDFTTARRLSFSFRFSVHVTTGSSPTNARERSLHLPQHSRLIQIRDVDKDVISRMSVKGRTEPLLVEVVSDEANAAPKDKETVEGPDLDVFIGFFGGEGAAVA
jgi:hypothetical protein